MYKNIVKFLILFIFLMNINFVCAKDINLVNAKKDKYVQTKAKYNDQKLYDYLKELNIQAENINKNNIHDINNWWNKSEKEQEELKENCKETGLKIAQYEGFGVYEIDYDYIYLKYKDQVSPQMLIWLEYLKNNSQIIDDMSLLVDIEQIRNNITILENLVVNNPNFIARNEVVEELNRNAKLYVFNLDNSPIFDIETGKIKENYKESYERFLKENRESKFYNDIANIYKLISNNNYQKIDLPNIEYQDFGVVIITPEVEKDLKLYLDDIQKRIKSCWNPPKNYIDKEVIIQFKVGKDGKLLSYKLYKSSGFPIVDRAAINALKLSAPFSVLPDSYKGKSIDINFTFQ